MTWPRLSRRGKAPDPRFDGPFEGVPTWVASTLVDWASAWFFDWDHMLGRALPQRDRLQQAERELQFRLTWDQGEDGALNSLFIGAQQDAEFFLDLVDWVAARASVDRLAKLEVALREAGSEWSVAVRETGIGGRLEKRVDPATTDLVKTAAPASSRSAHHLGVAWSAVYGRQRNPSHAYREAVRAVEAAGQPIISPKNPKATLGTMIADMDVKPAKWRSSLEPATGGAIEKVVGMMRLLWTAQLDRHGTSDESVPLSVSQPEAEAAVHLAATLVHWFTSGGIVTVP